MEKGTAAVIGAGIGGIATAIRLAAMGFTVSVFEKNTFRGGKLSEIREGGYRFDAGPSLFTMPKLVEELFELCGEDPAANFRYKKLDIICNYFYEDGTRISSYSDIARFGREVEEKTGEPAENVIRFLEKSRELYDITADLFIYSSFHGYRNFLTSRVLKKLVHIPKLRPFSTMHEANSDQFSDPRIIQLFNRYATYNGSDPYQAPAALNVIPSLEYTIGAFLPENGMFSIIEALTELALRQGVTFNYGDPVLEILHDGSSATGIRTAEGNRKFTVVVSNADIHFTYSQLLKNIEMPKKVMDQERSTSALVFNWGIEGSFPELELHNIFFSADYAREFDRLFRLKTVDEDPTVYIFISSKAVEGDAPPGYENWFTMINVPENTGQDWDALIEQARSNILRKLERMLGKNIASRIRQESVQDPRRIEQRTGAYHGSLYGSSSNNKWAAFNRHANYSNKLKNLYFAGGSVHPGGGIPLCLSSAKIVASLIADA